MNGYLAITSAIILSAVLMILALGLSLSSFFNSSDITDSNFKEMSYFLSEACAETAVLKLIQNSGYAGNETISVGSSTCTILPLEASSSQKIVKTRANSGGAVTNLKITVETAPATEIVNWEEY